MDNFYLHWLRSLIFSGFQPKRFLAAGFLPDGSKTPALKYRYFFEVFWLWSP